MPRFPNSLLLAVALAIAGCGQDAAVTPDDGGLRTNHTTVAGLIEAYQNCLTEKNLDAYAALLHPDFEYHNDQLQNWPWVPESGWDLALELQIVDHMFDPSFVSVETGENLDTIVAHITSVREEETSADGETRLEVTTEFISTALWGFGWGAYTDSRMVFELVSDESGFLRIHRLEEFEFGFEPGRDTPVIGSASWTVVKAMYR